MRLLQSFALSLSLFLTCGTASPSVPSLPADFDVGSLINLDLVTHINVIITLASLTDNLATTNFDLENSLIVPLLINEISSNAGVNDTVFATFSHVFNPPLFINPGETVNSGNITNVDLPQGATNSLDIIPGGFLNLDSSVVVFGIPISGLKQNDVPTSFALII